MESDKLIEITKALRLEVINILYTYDLTNDKRALEALTAIDDMFERLDVAVEDVIPEDMMHSYFEGIDNAGLLMSEAGVSVAGGLQASISSSGKIASAFKTQAHLAAIAEVTDNTMMDLKAAIRTAQQNTYFTLKTVLEEVKDELQSGIIRGNTRRDITAKVAQAFERDGLKAFKTIDDKWLPLDFYAETVVRTNLKDANVKGAVNRYLDNDVELVRIFERDDGCDECARYNGIVVSLTGKHEGYPTVHEAPLPPRHPSCRGSVHPYVIEYVSDKEMQEDMQRWKEFDPNKDVRSESDKKAYAEQQRLNRINNYEKKRYATVVATIGKENSPKTLGAFKRMKRSNSKGYKELMQKMREANNKQT